MHLLWFSLNSEIFNVIYIKNNKIKKERKEKERDKRTEKRNINAYEGCPSKSWTIVITRDRVPVIL